MPLLCGFVFCLLLGTTAPFFDYLLYAQSLSDFLTSISHPVSNEDLVTSVLRGLGLAMR